MAVPSMLIVAPSGRTKELISGSAPILLQHSMLTGRVALEDVVVNATINMDGTAIYQAVCAVFIACCYGVELTLGDMAMIVLTATLASVGTAGVSGAGMIMLAMVLTQVGLPVEGIAIIAGVDKIFDMGRTTLNITGDATCALFISRLEREKAAKKAAKAAK